MNYKIVAISLLISGSILAVENKKAVALPNDKTSSAGRIKELENRKIKIETDAAELSSCMIKEGAKLCLIASGAQYCWKPSCISNQDVVFGNFLLNLSDMFNKGEDIKQLINVSVIQGGGVNEKEKRLIFLAFVIQKSYIDRMVNEYEQLSEKLLAINKELHALKAAQK